MAEKISGRMWHAMAADAVLSDQHAGRSGISAGESRQRLEKFGPNKIREEKAVSGWEILLRQLMSFFNYVLYAAAIVAFIAKKPGRCFFYLRHSDYQYHPFLCAGIQGHAGHAVPQEPDR